jgi:hypothetical protein
MVHARADTGHCAAQIRPHDSWKSKSITTGPMRQSSFISVISADQTKPRKMRGLIKKLASADRLLSVISAECTLHGSAGINCYIAVTVGRRPEVIWEIDVGSQLDRKSFPDASSNGTAEPGNVAAELCVR